MRVATVLLLIACFHLFPEDVISLPSNVRPVDLLQRPVRAVGAGNLKKFRYLWLASDGNYYDQSGPGRLEIAGTSSVVRIEMRVGTHIAKMMTRNMPSEVWDKLVASKASVGLFTRDDKTTDYPEYAKQKDRPECKGVCNGTCTDTCTADGRKYDDLAGVGGIRATCTDENFMCYSDDPYERQLSVLVHEFAHTVHQHGLPDASKYADKIRKAYQNARTNKIWDLDSYAMRDELEYFAEATGAFFDTDKLPAIRTGGMNSCGHKDKMCKDEQETRAWLAKKDPQLFDALSYTWTNNRPTLPGGLEICVHQNDVD